MKELDDLLGRAVAEAWKRAAASSGLWPHSTQKSYFIFSVGNEEKVIADFLRWTFTHQVNVKPLTGHNNGLARQCFIANMKDFGILSSWLSGQESVLVLDRFDARDRPSVTMRRVSGEETHLGKLHSVPWPEAARHLQWTYDPLTKAYFVIKT